MKMIRFISDAAVSLSLWYSSAPPPAEPPAPTATVAPRDEEFPRGAHNVYADPSMEREPEIDLPTVRRDALADVEATLESHKRMLISQGESESSAHDSIVRILAGVKADFGLPGGFDPPFATRAERNAKQAITSALKRHKARLASIETTQSDSAPPPPRVNESWKAKIAGLDVPPPEPSMPRAATPSKNVYASPQTSALAAPQAVVTYEAPAPAVRYVYREPATAPAVECVPATTSPVVTMAPSVVSYYSVVPATSYAMPGAFYGVPSQGGLFGGAFRGGRTVYKSRTVCRGASCPVPQ